MVSKPEPKNFSGIFQFSIHLLTLYDLDPVYTMLAEANLGRNTLQRWMLAYWLFQHAGAASRCAEYTGAAFWQTAFDARAFLWPRGYSRRFFGGSRAQSALNYLYQRFPTPEGAIEDLAPYASQIFPHFAAKIRTWPQFGPSWAYRAADMLERVCQAPIFFDAADIAQARPIAAVKLLSVEWGEDDLNFKDAVSRLKCVFGETLIAPWFERTIGMQEIETMLRKYLAFRTGDYMPGQERYELHAALESWGPLAARLQKLL